MKPLGVLVALLAVTATAVALRGFFSHPVQAARAPEPAERLLRATVLDRRPVAAPPRGLLPASGMDKSDAGMDLRLARQASQAGDYLLDRARKTTDNRHLLEQAAQHYRACLAHEPTARGAGSLFTEVRARLAQVERLQSSPAAPTAERLPAPLGEEEPGPVPAVKAPPEEGAMVGPDGVIYRRSTVRDD